MYSLQHCKRHFCTPDQLVTCMSYKIMPVIDTHKISKGSLQVLGEQLTVYSFYKFCCSRRLRLQLPGEEYLRVMNLQAAPGEPSALARSIHKLCFYVTQWCTHGQIEFVPGLPISAEQVVILILGVFCHFFMMHQAEYDRLIIKVIWEAKRVCSLFQSLVQPGKLHEEVRR